MYAAPGDSIVGASNEGEFESTTMSGTSVAAAFAAGTATMFLEQILADSPQSTFPFWVKEKMYDKAEKDVLGDIGHMSINRMLQTVSVSVDDTCIVYQMIGHLIHHLLYII